MSQRVNKVITNYEKLEEDRQRLKMHVKDLLDEKSVQNEFIDNLSRICKDKTDRLEKTNRFAQLAEQVKRHRFEILDCKSHARGKS